MRSGLLLCHTHRDRDDDDDGDDDGDDDDDGSDDDDKMMMMMTAAISNRMSLFCFPRVNARSEGGRLIIITTAGHIEYPPGNSG